MSYILNIDTALETASICLAKNGETVAYAENHTQKDHSTWLHSTIKTVLEKNDCQLSQLEAVSVNNGPGSYTGIRIGLSAAKGLCYALQKPLLTVTSLELIAFTAKNIASGLICPVVDARRMEVYYAVYSNDMALQQEPAAHIITENSFTDLLQSGPVLFCGTGCKKLQTAIHHPNASFHPINGTAKEMSPISFRKFENGETAPLVQTDPLYIKDFFTFVQKA